MQEALFNANLNALKNPLLKQELLSIKESKFKLIVGKNELDVLSLIHISEPTRLRTRSRMPSSA